MGARGASPAGPTLVTGIRSHRMPERRNATHVAYFSMEMALDSIMPTYSGGLGVLAGDTLRAAADAGLVQVELAQVAQIDQVLQAAPLDPGVAHGERTQVG